MRHVALILFGFAALAGLVRQHFAPKLAVAERAAAEVTPKNEERIWRRTSTGWERADPWLSAANAGSHSTARIASTPAPIHPLQRHVTHPLLFALGLGLISVGALALLPAHKCGVNHWVPRSQIIADVDAKKRPRKKPSAAAMI